jgi:hypothetical protein
MPGVLPRSLRYQRKRAKTDPGAGAGAGAAQTVSCFGTGCNVFVTREQAKGPADTQFVRSVLPRGAEYRLENGAGLPGTEFVVADPLRFAQRWFPTGRRDDPFKDLLTHSLDRHPVQNRTRIEIHVV